MKLPNLEGARGAPPMRLTLSTAPQKFVTTSEELVTNWPRRGHCGPEGFKTGVSDDLDRNFCGAVLSCPRGVFPRSGPTGSPD